MTTRVLSALVGVVVGGFGLAADPCTSSQPRILVLTQEHTIWLCDRPR